MNYRRLKAACYANNITMAVVGNLSPVLFLTFRSLYGISYSQLGFLVLLNFVTQLTVDIAFSFLSHRVSIPFLLRLTPCLSILGLGIYALWPFVFAQTVYPGLIIGTVIFSASAGFSEALVSPVIAAIPAKDPEREMSKLHSIYAWGVVAMILVSTAVLTLCGRDAWQWLALGYTTVPLAAFLLFLGSELPPMETPERIGGVVQHLKNKTFWACLLVIFLGGASECTMAQWSSGYLERALGIPKFWGDTMGVAAFSLMLGLGRSLYGRYGRRVDRVMLAGVIGASVCYVVCALSPFPVLGLVACALSGLCVSMLWPGSLILASDQIPHGGVFLYAMMAAGGDFGASVGPQLVGLVTDFTMTLPGLTELAERLSLTGDQLGMKLGLLVGALFPLLAIPLYWRMASPKRQKKRPSL